MISTGKLANCLIAIALLTTPFLLLAQSDDNDQTDTGVAVDVATDVAGQVVGLPMSSGSALQMGMEKATGLPFSVDSAIGASARAVGISDSVAAILSGAAAGFNAVTFAPSSIATDEEEGTPDVLRRQEQQAQEAAAAYQFYVSHQAELDRSYHNWLYNPKTPPAGPQITNCTAYCNK